MSITERSERIALERRIQSCLSDAAVHSASPRLRICAAQDAAMLAAVLIGQLHGVRLKNQDPAAAMEFLRMCLTAFPGIERHAALLATFDRNDCDNSVSLAGIEAERALLAAKRIHTLVRWMLRCEVGPQSRPMVDAEIGRP